MQRGEDQQGDAANRLQSGQQPIDLRPEKQSGPTKRPTHNDRAEPGEDGELREAHPGSAGERAERPRTVRARTWQPAARLRPNARSASGFGSRKSPESGKSDTTVSSPGCRTRRPDRYQTVSPITKPAIAAATQSPCPTAVRRWRGPGKDQRRNHGHGQAELTEQHVDEHCGNTEGQRMIHDAACANRVAASWPVLQQSFGRAGYLREGVRSFGTSTVNFSSARCATRNVNCS